MQANFLRMQDLQDAAEAQCIQEAPYEEEKADQHFPSVHNLGAQDPQPENIQ